MTADTTTTLMAQYSSQPSPFKRRLTSAFLVTAILSACAGSDSATPDEGSDSVRSEVTTERPRAVFTAAGSSDAEPGGVSVETRNEIGPRAIDVGRAMMMIVDSILVSGDDIFVRMRVVNGSDRSLGVGNIDTFYGSLLVLRDDRGKTYLSRSVEPAGVDGYSVGHFDLRLDGPIDPDATELTFELATHRGQLRSEPVAAPNGDAVRWSSEAQPVSFSDLAVSDQSNRTVQVLEIVDRGTHLEVSVSASDESSGFSIPADTRATLALSDGTELESLDRDPVETGHSKAMSGVLRFPGTLPTESHMAALNMAGIDVDIPVGEPPSTALEPAFAELPKLPDLLDAKITQEPLPTSILMFGDLTDDVDREPITNPDG